MYSPVHIHCIIKNNHNYMIQIINFFRRDSNYTQYQLTFFFFFKSYISKKCKLILFIIRISSKKIYNLNHIIVIVFNYTMHMHGTTHQFLIKQELSSGHRQPLVLQRSNTISSQSTLHNQYFQNLGVTRSFQMKRIYQRWALIH